METNAGGAVMKRVLLAMFILLFFSGCNSFTGGYWKMSEQEYWEAIHYKPALYSWYKDGVSSEEKLKDWVACGGDKKGITFPWNEVDVKKEMRPDDIDNDHYRYLAFERLQAKFGKCIENKGYTRLPNETVDKMYESRKINGKWQWVKIHSSPPGPNE
jgi:hypothetical protein